MTFSPFSKSSSLEQRNLFPIFLLSLLLVRLPIALLQRTPFQPDETYQSLEPAHALVFGYGHLTWEWRFNEKIPDVWWGWMGEGRLRSGGWVGVWAGVYWVAKLLGGMRGDEGWLLLVLPKLVMALIASLCDTSTYALARRVYGSDTAPTALLLSLSSLFFGHALTRPFANSVETTLTILALCWWPFPSSEQVGPPYQDSKSEGALQEIVAGRCSSKDEVERRNVRVALTIAAVTTTLRPTNLVLWIFLGSELVYRRLRAGQTARAFSLAIDSIAIGSAVLGLSTLLDTLLFPPPPYSTLPISHPLLTFLTYNLLLPTSLFYGSNPFHYYLTQALPVLLFASLPWTILALREAARGRLSGGAEGKVKAGRLLLKLVAGTIGVYSLIGHKEWRFLMPILPLLYILTAAYLTRSTPSSTTSSFASSTSASPIYPSSARYHLPPILCSFFPQSTIRLPNPKILCILILLPLPFLTYLTLYHGAAQHSVITSYLRHDPSVSSFGVLMPCHSIPWQSHLHREALDRESWFLTCEPPKTVQASTDHQTQESAFYASPARYLLSSLDASPTLPSSFNSSVPSALPSSRSWPSRLVLFSSLLDASNDPNAELSILLWDKGYREVWRRWNGFDWAQDDEKRRGDVVVLARSQ